MEIIHKPETEIFGDGQWRLLSRDVVDETLVTMRVFAVTGRGFLCQISRQVRGLGADADKWSSPVHETPFLIPDVLLIEYRGHEASQVLDAQNQPTSVSIFVFGRELISVHAAKDKFQGKKAARVQGMDRVNLIAGSIFGFEQASAVIPPSQISTPEIQEAGNGATAQGQ